MKTWSDAFLDNFSFWANLVGILAAILTVISMGCLFFAAMESGRRANIAKQISDRENAKLNVEAGLARQEAGEAIKQAALANEQTVKLQSTNVLLATKVEELRKSNLELQLKLQPRHLTEDQINELVNRLKQFPGQRAEMIIGNVPDEAEKLREQIQAALIKAGWSVKTSQFVTVAGAREGVTVFISKGQPGVVAGEVLSKTLNEFSIAALFAWEEGLIPTPLEPGVVGILVGPKPTR